MHSNWTNPTFEDRTLRDLEVRRDALKDILMEIDRYLFEIDVEIVARGLASTEIRQ